MKLFYANSVCSLAVRIILHELNVNCDFEAVSLKTKVTETGNDYLNINPKGSVPALLLDNNEILTENAVILQYLADKYNATHLLPAINDMKRYRTLEWLNFISTDLHRFCAPLFWSKFTDEIKKNVFWPILNSKLTIVEKHLENQSFLMGNQFTLPDAYLLVILIWLAKLKTDLSVWPNLSRFYLNMKQLPFVQKALIEENLMDL